MNADQMVLAFFVAMVVLFVAVERVSRP